MKATLSIEATSAGDLPALAAVISTLGANWPTDTAPAALNTAATTEADAPAPAPAAQPQGEPAKPAEPAETSTGPMRGKNAENHANAIIERLNGAETVGGLEDILADAAPTLERLPAKLRESVQNVANARKLVLPETVEEPVDQADIDARLAAMGAPAPQPEPAAQPTGPAAADYLVFEGDGEKRAGYAHAKDAAHVIKVLLDACTEQDGINDLLEANAATLTRMGDPLKGEVEAHANARRMALLMGDAPAAPAAEVVTLDQCRAALEACIAEVSFAEAAARMSALGWPNLSAIPDTNEARAQFVAKLSERAGA